MRLASYTDKDHGKICLCESKGCIPLEQINRQLDCDWPTEMLDLLDKGRLNELHRWYLEDGRKLLVDMNVETIEGKKQSIAPLYRHPPKIWGIGLNYADHAADLSAKTPTGIPGSFMKPDSTIIGPGETILIPEMSHKTTAEAELGVIISQKCRDVPEDNWLDVVAGFTTIIDMTAEDILRQNTRYLTVSKSFDTFFSFGPQLVTPDEIENVSALTVSTIINGNVHAENLVANMTFPPAFLVAFLSQVMTLLPGDIISTGTPGAVAINDGDVVECRIDGFEPLINPVKDLKALK
jgi:2-keto-4-pentenoate hydratase/2-oxohepta-3-ene-1,7-dioic acid hydratase in catechol pathway